MSTETDILRGVVAEVAKELISWGVKKAREKIKAAGHEIPDATIEALLVAELFALDVSTRVMAGSVGTDIDKMRADEAAFQALPNVTIVDDTGKETQADDAARKLFDTSEDGEG